MCLNLDRKNSDEKPQNPQYTHASRVNGPSIPTRRPRTRLAPVFVN